MKSVNINTVIRVLENLNREAKSATDSRTREMFYAMKAAILMECVRRCPTPVVLVHFQTLPNQQWSVVFTLTGASGARCWHLPWSKLDARARVEIAKMIGSPPSRGAAEESRSESSVWIG